MSGAPGRGLVLALALLYSATAGAIAAVEFMKLDATGKRKALEPIIHSFLTAGYKKIPDWPELSARIRSKILEKGYTYQSLEAVAEEAAKEAGMTR